MDNPQFYITSPMNKSKSKEAHSFSKEGRFSKQKRLYTEAEYTLPSTITKRSCSFGFGNKSEMFLKRASPPPGTYQSISEFDKKSKFHKTPSFGKGRQSVLFGSFLKDAKDKKNLPSPNKYTIYAPRSTVGGRMFDRISTDYDLKRAKLLPGPGTYSLSVTEMKKSGGYVLSNFKNNISPRYHSKSSALDPQKKLNQTHVPSYNIDEKEFGKSTQSKFKNVFVRTFSKAKRQGLADKSKMFVPGFKYAVYSQFGNPMKP